MKQSKSAERIAQLEQELLKLEQSFDVRWDSDMRAIRMWKSAHPGQKKMWPDHADLVVWLMEQLAKKK